MSTQINYDNVKLNIVNKQENTNSFKGKNLEDSDKTQYNCLY